MKKRWTISWSSKIEGLGSGFFFVVGSESDAIHEVEKLKERFKKAGRRPKIKYEQVIEEEGKK